MLERADATMCSVAPSRRNGAAAQFLAFAALRLRLFPLPLGTRIATYLDLLVTNFYATTAVCD